MTTSVLATVGRRVREMRSSRGWGRDELAARAGLDSQKLHRLETGKPSAPVLVQLCRISAALGVSLSELVEEPGWVSVPRSLHDAGLARNASYQVMETLNRASVRRYLIQPEDWMLSLGLSDDNPQLFDILLDHPEIIDSLRASA